MTVTCSERTREGCLLSSRAWWVGRQPRTRTPLSSVLRSRCTGSVVSPIATPGTSRSGWPPPARAWLYRIAHRVALDELRRRRIIRFLPFTGEHKGSAPSPEHLAMDLRLSGDLQRALERIPERQRSALLLAELHDLTGLELAEALGVSHVAARALLTRARESLRQALAVERKAQAEAEARRDQDGDSRRGWGRRP